MARFGDTSNIFRRPKCIQSKIRPKNRKKPLHIFGQKTRPSGHILNSLRPGNSRNFARSYGKVLVAFRTLSKGQKFIHSKKWPENQKKSPSFLDHKIPPTSPILNPSTPGESRDNLPAGVLRFRDPTSPF